MKFSLPKNLENETVVTLNKLFGHLSAEDRLMIKPQ